MSAASVRRSGVVALAGAPNVGKSTLLNALVGTRLSITTAKPQTTRRRVTGILEHGSCQIAFADVPGIHSPRAKVQQRMVAEARRETAAADLACWLVAADRGLGRVDQQEASRLRELPLLVLINKTDLLAGPRLLPLMAEISERFAGAECLPLSARSGEGLDRLLDRISELLPERPWTYPADTLTDRSERFLVAEIIREQLLRQLQDEVPYRTAVKVEGFEERPDGAYIEADIFTDSDSTKAMIIGAGGSRIKKIGKAARLRAAETTGRRSIYLDLRVRVKRDWQNDPRFLEELDA